MSLKATAADVSIRKFDYAEIEPLADYWSRGSADYWRTRGVDKSKLKSKEEFMAFYKKKLDEEGDLRNAAIIVFKGEAVGVHTLTDVIEKEQAIFHAHIWDEKYRGLGIGIFSYLMAAEFFMKKFGFKKIIFKTPKMNTGPNRIKEKIGIPKVGDTIFENEIFIRPVEANLYELDAQLLAELKARHGISS